VSFQESPQHEKQQAAEAPHVDSGRAPTAQADHPASQHAAGAETDTHAAASGAHAELTKDEFNSKPWLERLQLAKSHYLDLGHLLGHVQDSDHFEVPKFLGEKWEIPNPLGTTKENPLISIAGKPFIVGRLTKFMVLELVAALILCVVFIRFARRMASQDRPRGALANTLEAFVVYIRDEIAVPCIGSKDANRFLPFLLTLFFFILMLNLIGILPWLGAATGALGVTAVLAVSTFAVVLFSGIKKMGLIGFLKAQVPHMDLSKPMAIVLIPMIWSIEVFGLIVKHGVLALRLFANMFAGHLVLAVLLAFVGVTASTMLVWGVAPLAIIGSILFSLLEVLVVFLQAYIFTFLAALFIGSAQHAH
jgi:F-type H+-transporting ATPase subunit a